MDVQSMAPSTILAKVPNPTTAPAMAPGIPPIARPTIKPPRTASAAPVIVGFA
eukprot:CAMPEP_0184344052 /NCGR_PEP_ID=MMETSP1089-20130417/12573_1 /TAXON_ID=38269 ORGANISM="Gloeochaete wittrockiana, Strain SAG46.84" /NCGR_SAMPLE_ID=MMETSP1089 /ASSEMBLY_ACC=CAM_ASM_000445 /LENGTH=52 /DNA_ID=CAMNT_0026673693 /DNA_START=184 /DNA_END=342 /DNA_ORIENTATION=+